MLGDTADFDPLLPDSSEPGLADLALDTLAARLDDHVSRRAAEVLPGDIMAITRGSRRAVRLGLPLRALRYLLPDLYPARADKWDATAPATTSP